jgi:hypothetical protein
LGIQDEEAEWVLLQAARQNFTQELKAFWELLGIRLTSQAIKCKMATILEQI